MLFYINKEFLAPKASSQDSAVVATIHVPTEVTKYADVSVDLTISDCSQNCCIGFRFSKKEEFKESIDKLDVLIRNLTDLKKQMQKAEKQWRPKYEKVRGQ